MNLDELRFFATVPHECSYLPERTARTVFVDPELPKSPALYSLLAAVGFRRSGDGIYVPYCEDCKACVSVRVDASAFEPRRKHRRVLKRNMDVDKRLLPAEFSDEHFALYSAYQRAKHAGGSMADHTPEDYCSFLLSSWSETQLMELRVDDELLAVAVLDAVNDGWSCVYTFFDVNASARSPGVLAILLALEHAKLSNLPWVYLGYWIDGCDKMSYKDQYYPQERFERGAWRRWPGPGL